MSAPDPITLSYLGAVPGSYIGSIGAGSNQLTLNTTAHRIKPGHDIIMETGGEAGGGAIATDGVGGTWPPLAFATTAELLAHTPASELETDSSATAAWARDTGFVHYRAAAAWTQPATKYLELRYAIPLALRARVLAVSGATLTLDTTASVASSGANVYVDCYRVLARLLDSPGSLVSVDGEYALGRTINNEGADSVSLVGDGVDDSRIFSPRGCPWLTLKINTSDDLQIADIEFERKWTGQAIWKGMIGYRPPTDFPYPQVLGAHSCADARLQSLRIINGGFGSALLRASHDGELREVEAITRNVYLRYYHAQWAIALSDCARSSIVNCSYDADVLSEALEIHAGDSCFVAGFTARNGLAASNSNITCNWSGLDFVVYNTAGPERPVLETFVAGGLLNWNNHFVAIPAEGGSLSDSRFVVDPSTPAEIATQLPQLFVRHSALQAALDPITVGPGVEFVTSGLVPRAVNAESGDPTQALHFDGVTADGEIKTRYGSVTNTTAATLVYCPSDVTLGEGNAIATLTENCG